MKGRILKYEEEVSDYMQIRVPKPNFFISVISQSPRKLSFYFSVADDDDEILETINFHAYGTGLPVDDHKENFLATVKDADGHHIWHIFGGLIIR